jgi:hypothetical protein
MSVLERHVRGKKKVRQGWLKGAQQQNVAI